MNRFRQPHAVAPFANGCMHSLPKVFLPRLLAATPQQRQRYVFSENGTGTRWDDLGEDIRGQGLIMGSGDPCVLSNHSRMSETQCL
ncbi:MAG: DUF2442 domain-containing protein [Pseudomonadota bacterium]